MKRQTLFLRLIALCCVPLLLGFLGKIHPAFDSLAHFRIHLAVLTALLALPLLAGPRKFLALSTLVFAFSTFVTTIPTSRVHSGWPVQAAFDTRDGERAIYRLLQMNLRYDNATPEKVLSLIGRTQPDVITLNEVSATWKERLTLLSASYPHQLVCPFPNGIFGVAIFSRRPFEPDTQPRCFDRGAMAIAKVDFGGTSVDVAAIHLSWPWPFEQSWQIGTVSKALGSLAETSIMAGDCNSTPWSAAVRRVADLGGLTLMPSVGPTWLYIKLPDFLRFAGLPIDQVFSKGDVSVRSAIRLEDTGSDHLPVMVEFSIIPREGHPDSQRQTAIVSLPMPQKHRA